MSKNHRKQLNQKRKKLFAKRHLKIGKYLSENVKKKTSKKIFSDFITLIFNGEYLRNFRKFNHNIYETERWTCIVEKDTINI